MAGLRVVAVLLLGAGLSSCLDPPLRRPVSSDCVDLVEHKPGEEPPDTVEWDWFQVTVTWVSPEATGGAFAFQMFGNERSRQERMPPDPSEPRRTVYREDAPPHLQIGNIHVGEPAWWSQALHYRVFGPSSCDTMERVNAGRPLPAPSAMCDRSPIMELLGIVQIIVESCPTCVQTVAPQADGRPRLPYLKPRDKSPLWVRWRQADGPEEDWVFISARWRRTPGDEACQLDDHITMFVDFSRAAQIRRSDGSLLLGSFLGELFKLVPADMSEPAADLNSRFPDLFLAYPE